MKYEFEVDGVRYRADKLHVFDQMEIAQTLMPVLLGLAPGPEQMLNFAAALGSIKRDRLESLIATCLANLERFQGDSWSRVWNVSAKRAQFDDLNYDLLKVFKVVAEIVKENLQTFLTGLPTLQSTPGAPKT